MWKLTNKEKIDSEIMEYTFIKVDKTNNQIRLVLPIFKFYKTKNEMTVSKLYYDSDVQRLLIHLINNMPADEKDNSLDGFIIYTGTSAKNEKAKVVGRVNTNN